MPANRDYQDVGWINQRQTVTQAADKGIEGLFRNPNSFFLSPDIIDQVLPFDNFSLLLVQDLQQSELGN